MGGVVTWQQMMPKPGGTTEPFGWLCNMAVVRLPAPARGCVVYSPILAPGDAMEPVVAALTEVMM